MFTKSYKSFSNQNVATSARKSLLNVANDTEGISKSCTTDNNNNSYPKRLDEYGERASKSYQIPNNSLKTFSFSALNGLVNMSDMFSLVGVRDKNFAMLAFAHVNDNWAVLFR